MMMRKGTELESLGLFIKYLNSHVNVGAAV